MLSQSAFNAFLKTLEEPPEYAIFILATTEKHKIIPTILSRCQIFDFKRIQTLDMVAHLDGIAKEEGIEVEQEALHIIAQKADGALRDALSIFDRIVAFAGKKMTYEDVIINLNVLDYDYFFKLVDALLMEDIQQTLLVFDDIQRKGFDADLFVTGLSEHLRNLLVCKDEQTLQLLDTSDSLRERYRQQAALARADFLLTTINLANDCDINYKLARNKRLHVEITLLKMASIGRAFRLAAGNISSEEEKKNPESSLASLPRVNTTEKQPSTAITQPQPAKEETAGHQKEGINIQDTSPSQNIADTDSSTNSIIIDQEEIDTESLSIPQPSVKSDDEPQPKETLKASASQGMAKADLSSLMAEIRAEEAQEVEVVTSLEFEKVQKVWDAYTEKVDRDSLKFQLKNANLALEDMVITVSVASALAEGAIRSEYELTNFLRTKLKAPDLMLMIEIDSTLRKEEVIERPKIMNAKEKYLFMRDQNPAVDELRKRFDLRPDE